MQGKTEALKKSDTRGDLARESEHMRNKGKNQPTKQQQTMINTDVFLSGWKLYKGREKYSFTNAPESAGHGC